MVKSGSQRQKEYLKRLKEKNREEYLEKERKRKKGKAVVENHRQTAIQRQITKWSREEKITKSNKKTTGMLALLWTC